MILAKLSAVSVRRLAALAGSRRRLSTTATKASPGSDDVFDLAVIGGGSGGLACAKEAADLGARVCVFDYVAPTGTRGTTWGLGGTCVNVGCIPKKLMHLAALHGEAMRDAPSYGWRLGTLPTHDWTVLTDAVRQHVKSLNFGHRSQLMQRGVEYYNMLARFESHGGATHLITGVNPAKPNVAARSVRASRVVIAVGGRPTLPSGVPGAAELGITSDDLFWLRQPPGRTLVVGGGYVALECAGFLAGLGHPAEVMVRTDVCLRGFDRQMAVQVTDYMRDHCGVGFRLNCSPVALEKADGDSGDGVVRVSWRASGPDGGATYSAVYDTVLFATGRQPSTGALNLAAAGVQVDSHGRVLGGLEGEAERTSAPGVYVIGDALKDGVELTPVAVQAGKLLARRLFAGSRACMEYDRVATTVFTPLEYACVGLSEEAALSRWGGPEDVEVYHAVYTPYEFLLPHRDQSQCWVKAICGPAGASGESRPLVGLHVTGPNAGEILQGFAALMLRGTATIADLTDTVGIHPTSAEEVTKLWITKRSGLSPKLTGC